MGMTLKDVLLMDVTQPVKIALGSLVAANLAILCYTNTMAFRREEQLLNRAHAEFPNVSPARVVLCRLEALDPYVKRMDALEETGYRFVVELGQIAARIKFTTEHGVYGEVARARHPTPRM